MGSADGQAIAGGTTPILAYPIGAQAEGSPFVRILSASSTSNR